MVGRGFTEKEKLRIKEWMVEHRAFGKGKWNESNALLRMDIALSRKSVRQYNLACTQWLELIIRQLERVVIECVSVVRAQKRRHY